MAWFMADPENWFNPHNNQTINFPQTWRFKRPNSSKKVFKRWPSPISPHLRWRVHPKSCMCVPLSKRCPIHRSARPNHGYSRYRNIIGLQWEYIHGNTNWKVQPTIFEWNYLILLQSVGRTVHLFSIPDLVLMSDLVSQHHAWFYLNLQFWLTSFLRADPPCFEPSPEVKAKSISSLSPAPSAQLVCFFPLPCTCAN